MTLIEAGAAKVDITAPIGLSMGGYGARQGVSTGIHDPLYVRCATFSDGTTTVVLAVCDLVGVGPDMVQMARSQIERQTGIPNANVMVAATHTHSGPAGLRVGDVDADSVRVIARKVAGAVALAHSQRRAVTLKFGTFPVTTISQNRRHPDGPIEEHARLLLAVDESGGPVASLLNYACHATVLEHDNLLYSADFPGAACTAVEQALGGTAVYLQGACGDINPVWMRHDFDEVHRIGGILGHAAARVGHELRATGEGQWAVNLSWSEQTPKDNPGVRLAGGNIAAAREVVAIPRRQLPDGQVLAKEVESLQAALAEAGDDTNTRRSLRPRLNQLRMEQVFARRGQAEPGTTEDAEVQAFRLGPDCVVVTLPGEFFVDIGKEIDGRTSVPGVLIAGYANNYLGYFPTAEEFANGGYEVGCARFEPETAAMVVDAATRAIAAVT